MATTLLKKQATAFQHPEARRYRRVDVDTPAEICLLYTSDAADE